MNNLFLIFHKDNAAGIRCQTDNIYIFIDEIYNGFIYMIYSIIINYNLFLTYILLIYHKIKGFLTDISWMPLCKMESRIYTDVFQIVALTCASWIASFLKMTSTRIVIARNEAIRKKKNDNLKCTHLSA